jgi:hypothetical protein
LFCSSLSNPFITDITIIRLLTPIINPNIARKEVNEKTPPLLDLKYLNAKFKEREDTAIG